ncbi:MAG TPA: co-chaperone GroES [Marinilabiliales bacterium]|jgi:chaperonin GroES|nr:MAG: co-chaperone GroES [Bacteroidetes bacterium GWA2_40_14]OFX57622.1 MAG: co-chaperone GroES [Bacteroidetes bacterium GWC2_40_13]OFX73518.1 MAG: co-chaperone GroES [Bacteroidetes bacterium GWD2_40_43]OFX90806.1 MAG: co-chaperone GroES [Bacteroidetes bacterium GWE2_40_63]OFY20562.1 MAG: co-chaperone GroES [Bacteroidetes bacterium GWF2_40_13]OFZ24116.1 MAG: co-chaperone GroES [Bacteroidetes bacterium RIFOXYC2_FULL_40_12]HAN00472.1 co-chaperone GroES [Marinilabiliales bacterium]
MTKLNGKVIAGKVLVRPSEADEKTAGGLYIPDSAKDSPLQGEVVLVGSALKDQNIEVKTGDKVMYGKYAGTELNIENTKYLLISHNDILYVF